MIERLIMLISLSCSNNTKPAVEFHVKDLNDVIPILSTLKERTLQDPILRCVIDKIIIRREFKK